MRYLLFALLFIGWFFFGSWLYCCHVKETCCTPTAQAAINGYDAPSNSSSGTNSNGLNRPEVTAKKAVVPLFKWSEESITNNDELSAYIDSLSQLLKDQDILEVTGHYFRDEKNNSAFSNVGLARANKMKILLADKMDTSRVQLKSSVVDLNGDERNNQFSALNFRRKVNNDFIKEVDEKVLIYFPQNSTKKIDSPKLDEYLIDVVKRINQTNESVYLTGHTDAIGPAQSNEDLAYFRAGAIKDLLVTNGLSDSKIFVDTKGEKEPIASNKTNEGRKKNRRVELVIK